MVPSNRLGFHITILILFYLDWTGHVNANLGTEFLITLPQGFNEKSVPTVILTMDPDNQEENNIEVELIMKDPDFTEGITLTQESPGAIMSSLIEYIFPKGNARGHKYLIRVVSSGMISVVVRNGASSNFDSYLVLPITRLGSRYYALSYKDVDDVAASFVVVAAASQPAKVKFRFPLGYSNGIEFEYNNVLYSNNDVLEFSLESFEAVQCQFYMTDITGAYLESDEIVAVWSGMNRTGIRVTDGSKSHAIEQIPPTHMAGKQFATFPSPCNSNSITYLYRVVSIYQMTSLSVYSSENTNTYVLSRPGNVFTLTIDHVTSLTYIEASKPVIVYWIGESSLVENYYFGDVLSLWVPPLDVQMPSGYRLEMYRSPDIVNTISFVIAVDGLDGLSLNDKPLDQADHFSLSTYNIAGRPDLMAGCLFGTTPTIDEMGYVLKQANGVPFVAAYVRTSHHEGEGHPLSYGLQYDLQNDTKNDQDVCCMSVDNAGVPLYPNECSDSIAPYSTTCCIVDYQARSCQVKSASGFCSLSNHRKLSSSHRLSHADSILSCYRSCLDHQDNSCVGANYLLDGPHATSCELLFGFPMGFDEDVILGTHRHVECSTRTEYTLL